MARRPILAPASPAEPSEPGHLGADRVGAAPDTKVRLPRWILVLAAPVFLSVAGIYAFTTIFSKFAFYDDQGFLMITVQGYLTGHPLYDGVFTIYGPVYYFYQWVIHTLVRMPVNHNVAGVLCLVHWLSAAVILGLAGVRLTRSALLGFFIFAQAALHLAGLSDEPGHPQELVVLLLALAAFVAAAGAQRRIVLVGLAAIGAALIFIKINIGAFYALSLVLVLACYSPPFRAHRVLYGCLLALCALLPFLLMWPRLTEPLTRDYAWRGCVAICAVGAVAFAFATHHAPRHGRWFDASAAFGAVAAAILGVLLLTGTSMRTMLDCLVTIPAHMVTHFANPPMWGLDRTAWPAAESLAAALLAVLARKRLEQAPSLMAALKALYGFLGAWYFLSDHTLQLDFLLPWIWLGVLSIKGQQQKTSSTFARAFICMLAAWQGLQAYPIGGTQIAVATLLPVLVYSLCLHDAIVTLAAPALVRRHLAELSLRTAVLFRTMVLISLLYVFIRDWCHPSSGWRNYALGGPLELPGASLLRLPSRQAAGYRALARYLETECDTFFTVPGFNTLHFWSGKPPPTYFNVFERVCLNDREQSDVVAALRRAKRPLIVMNETRIASSDSAILGQGPLADFIRDHCRPLTRVAGCRILAPAASGDE